MARKNKRGEECHAPANPVGDKVGYWLRRASARMMTDLGKRLGAVGMSAPDASVLLFIRSNPGTSQSEIGRVLGIQRANMAPIVAQLDERGWIERGAAEGKLLPLFATADGATIADMVDRIIVEHETHCTAGISKAEILMLLDILPRIAFSEAHESKQAPMRESAASQ